MNKVRVIELFGGIGACTQALKRLGKEVEIVDYVEIDKYAVKSYNAINGTNFEPQDITKYNKHFDDVDLIMHGSPCQDFSLAGKQAGGDEGSGTRSSLMYETIRIVKDIKPKFVIWENVKNLLSKKHIHNFNAYIDTMSELGYKSYYQVLNAKNYGIPQNRERVFTISIRNDIDINYKFPEPKKLELKLKDLLEKEVDEKYFLSQKMIDYITADNEKWTGNNQVSLINKDIASALNTGEGSRRCDASNYICNDLEENYNLKIRNATKQGYLEATEGDGVDISSRMQYHRGNVQKETSQTITCQGGNNVGVVVRDKGQEVVKETDIANTLLARDYKGPGNFETTAVSVKGEEMGELRIRKLTPRECWRLMGFTDEAFDKAKEVNSDSQLYKQAGNSIVVDVLEAILGNLLED